MPPQLYHFNVESESESESDSDFGKVHVVPSVQMYSQQPERFDRDTICSPRPHSVYSNVSRGT